MPTQKGELRVNNQRPPQSKSPKRSNVIDITWHRKRLEAKNLQGKNEKNNGGSSGYANGNGGYGNGKNNKNAKNKGSPLKIRVALVLQFAAVAFGIAVLFRGCSGF